jgi:hypothetical protein
MAFIRTYIQVNSLHLSLSEHFNDAVEWQKQFKFRSIQFAVAARHMDRMTVSINVPQLDVVPPEKTINTMADNQSE